MMTANGEAAEKGVVYDVAGIDRLILAIVERAFADSRAGDAEARTWVRNVGAEWLEILLHGRE